MHTFLTSIVTTTLTVQLLIRPQEHALYIAVDQLVVNWCECLGILKEKMFDVYRLKDEEQIIRKE